MTKNKWALAVAAGAFTTAFIGGVALAGFQPFATSEWCRRGQHGPPGPEA